ncbi:hypothetical protein B296_00045084 [Ensete ventricosum]|uniref:Uncharacterized protein n=1 Tax=Ensete ventricosum TaxID=4639 RepID=A0A426X3T0_ENSVE|nr:hypothetical protein B296_00045084 [Ensete ventricosum]
MMQLETRLECVGSSPRVLRVCQNGAREFAGRRPKLIGRLLGVVKRLVRSWEGLFIGPKLASTPEPKSNRIRKIRVRAIYPPSAIGRCLDSVVQTVHPPPGQFTRRKLLPVARILCFSATPDNLPASLDLLLANSLVPSWQTSNTLGKLLTHSWRVSKCIDSMHRLNLGQP